ncbi:LysM peptidoglycan-binding domain-containing protein [Bacillus aerolatus]|uniref:LysM peptidoglycan-binding domain-containing protein n=1 Tax=Bacillus aerolatus TaxID=2653354 RepID=A0A6I1FP19_9BACI|nr:LysM peptidoglycan-binding domain-containing protein [Bacillus aerolatus]KAB7708184.1 LysM peptidoglycan-binding domain-containing protein [Bacillus aerolatus]
MMKTLVKENSFVLLFIAVTIMAGVMLILNMSEEHNPYKEITVQEGDSLWSIAGQYVKENGMKEEDFIIWVQKENKLYSAKIIPGDTLVIPVDSSQSYPDSQVAFKEE